MEGHGPGEMQHDQDEKDGSDDHGGDDPAPVIGPGLGLFLLIGMRIHGSQFRWRSGPSS